MIREFFAGRIIVACVIRRDAKQLFANIILEKDFMYVFRKIDIAVTSVDLRKIKKTFLKHKVLINIMSHNGYNQSLSEYEKQPDYLL